MVIIMKPRIGHIKQRKRPRIGRIIAKGVKHGCKSKIKSKDN